MGILFGWIVFSFVVALVGTDRKIGFWGSFLVSIFLSPLIGLIVTLVSKNKEDEAYKKKILSVQKSHLEELKKLSETGKTATVSVAAELEKLGKLKEEKLISEEEFQSLKSKVILGQLGYNKDEIKPDDHFKFENLTDEEKEQVNRFINFGIKKGEKLVINKKTRKIDRFDEKEWIEIKSDDFLDDWAILKEA